MKKLIVIILAIFIFCCFTACYATYNEWDEEQIEAYGFVIIKQMGRYGEGGVYLVYDPMTYVEYMAITGSHGNFSLCPYYDENGNVAFYKGD